MESKHAYCQACPSTWFQYLKPASEFWEHFPPLVTGENKIGSPKVSPLVATSGFRWNVWTGINTYNRHNKAETVTFFIPPLTLFCITPRNSETWHGVVSIFSAIILFVLTAVSRLLKVLVQTSFRDSQFFQTVFVHVTALQLCGNGSATTRKVNEVWKWSKTLKLMNRCFICPSFIFYEVM